jgi:6-phosphogluconate dehydrogenase
LYASKIISYTQGFLLLKQAAKDFKWNEINYGGIALMWRGGCIIRSVFLSKIQEAFHLAGPELPSLLFADFFSAAIQEAQEGWRSALQFAISHGIAVPAMSAALAFYDGYRTARLPANLIQAQRDYFGAHTFEIEGEEGHAVHVNWTGHGGNVTAGTYQA